MRSIATAVALALANCAPVPPQAAREGTAFDPIAFFADATQGHGTVNPLIGSDRALLVKSHGRLSGDRLVVDQRIHIGGERSRDRRWVLRAIGKGRYAARLTDADGPVHVDAVGRAIRVRYEALNGSRVEQWLTMRSDDCSLNNRLSVIRFGIEFARVTEVIEKQSCITPLP